MRYFVLFMLCFAYPSYAKEPIVAGYVEHHSSALLKQQRRFMVDLPENYRDNEFSYPTLYVIDGDFQFQHVSATVKNMARMGKIPPMIVVGIATQGNSDYIYQTTWAIENEKDYGGAPLFYQYLVQELVPHIDNQYRTNENRILSGYSLGGLFATYAMLQKKTPFNAYLAMSPSYWFDDYATEQMIIDYVNQQKNSNQRLAPLFLSVANEQGMGVDKIASSLDSMRTKQWQFSYRQYPHENHFSTALPALYDGLSFLFSDFYEDGYELQAHKNVFDVLTTFERKKQAYNGFRIEWLQAYKLAKYLFASKQTDKVDDVLAKIAHKFPDSLVNVTNYFAKGFNATKQFKQAQRILMNIKSQGAKTALWHHQYSLALVGLGQMKLAKKSQQQAMTLAKAQQLPQWQIWEMK